jgi:flagellar assembly protein FliH
MSIKPYQFDRVFRFEAAPREERDASAGAAELHARIAELEAALEAEREARAQAVANAHRDGMAEALVQARTERAEAQLAATDALHAAFDDLNAELASVTDRVTRESAEVALCAAEMLAGHAMAVQPGRAFDEALGRALHQVAFGTALMVRAHPDSIDHFEDFVAARRDRQGAVPTITLVPDDAIAVNDAHISWAQGGLIVDAAERRAAVERELSPLLRGDAV